MQIEQERYVALVCFELKTNKKQKSRFLRIQTLPRDIRLREVHYWKHERLPFKHLWGSPSRLGFTRYRTVHSSAPVHRPIRIMKAIDLRQQCNVVQT